jgi:Tfp pilus assembly protein PilO
MNSLESSQLGTLLRRNIFCTVCVILCLLLVSGLWILTLFIHSLEIVNRERSQEGAAMDSTLVTGPLIKQELARAQDTVLHIEGNLAIDKRLEDNLWYFYKIYPDSKDILTNLRALNADPASDDSDYKVLPFSVQLTGTYEQVAGYLLQLETGPRLMQIRSFSFRRQGVRSPVLTLNLDVRVLAKK